MSNTFGSRYRFTIWGQSHAPGLGVTIEGIPAGTRIDLAKLQRFLDRRRPGQNQYSTSRKEADMPEIIAGVTGATSVLEESATGEHIAIACGAPLNALIRNTNARSGDYENLRYVPRPGHSDYTAMIRYGEARDYAGGGQFSGRLTASLCIAGGIALQMLKERGIEVTARPTRIGGEADPDRMLAAIDRAREEGDSVGGIIECIITGVPAGYGEPMFDGVENRIAQAVFGIPAVKGIEFGNGFACADLRGSENNDPFLPAEPAPESMHDRTRTKKNNSAFLEGRGDSGNVAAGIKPSGFVRTQTASNNHGGALGGITSGMPIVFRAAFKPTPSISKAQDSVDIRTGEAVRLEIHGRHDPCIVLRAVPCVEAAAAAAVLDMLL